MREETEERKKEEVEKRSERVVYRFYRRRWGFGLYARGLKLLSPKGFLALLVVVCGCFMVACVVPCFGFDFLLIKVWWMAILPFCLIGDCFSGFAVNFCFIFSPNFDRGVCDGWTILCFMVSLWWAYKQAKSLTLWWPYKYYF